MNKGTVRIAGKEMYFEKRDSYYLVPKESIDNIDTYVKSIEMDLFITNKINQSMEDFFSYKEPDKSFYKNQLCELKDIVTKMELFLENDSEEDNMINLRSYIERLNDLVCDCRMEKIKRRKEEL